MSDNEIADFLEEVFLEEPQPTTDCQYEVVCFGKHRGLTCKELLRGEESYCRRLTNLVAEGSHLKVSAGARRQVLWITGKIRALFGTAVTERIHDTSLFKCLELGKPAETIEFTPMEFCNALTDLDGGLLVDGWVRAKTRTHWLQVIVNDQDSDRAIFDFVASEELNERSIGLIKHYKAESDVFSSLQKLHPAIDWLNERDPSAPEMVAMDRSPGVVGLRGNADLLLDGGKTVVEVKYSQYDCEERHMRQLAMYGVLYGATKLVLYNARLGKMDIWDTPADIRSKLQALI